MELLYVIVAVYVIFKFNRPLTTVVKVVDISANIADDTVDTYANEVHIMNADKRKDQAKILAGMGEVVTANDINVMLRGKTQKQEQEETPRETE